MKPRFLILLVGMNLLWAGTPPIYKVLAENLSSGSIATLRVGLAAACLLLCWPWLPGRGPRGRDLLRVITMGAIVFAAAPRLQIEGVHRGQAGDTSLLMALEPLIVAIAAALFLGERIASRRWSGCALGMIGVALVSNVWREEINPLQGLLPNLLFISSFVCESAYSVVGKPMLPRLGTLKLLGSALAAGTLMNLCLDAFSGTHTMAAARSMPLQTWGWILYLALICTVLGYALWYMVIRETEVNVTSLTVFVQPVAGFLISILWLSEPLHFGQLWGSLVIVAGLIIGLRPDSEKRISTAPATVN
jgi:drug/metabolite transporter (DMT)-like permease